MSTGYVYPIEQKWIYLEQSVCYDSATITKVTCDDYLCLTDRIWHQGSSSLNQTFITYKSESPEQYSDLLQRQQGEVNPLTKKLMNNMRMCRVSKVPYMRARIIDWSTEKMTYVSIGGCDEKKLIPFVVEDLYRS